MDVIETIPQFLAESACRAILAHLETQQSAPIVLASLRGRNDERFGDRLVMSVYNIRREPAADAARPALVVLDVAIAANYASHDTGLRMIARVAAHFEQNRVMSAETMPMFPAGVARLDIEMVSLTPADLAHVTGMLGTGGLPGVFYRVRPILAVDGSFASPK
ncbi:MAG: DUF4255 domain-containing protein [Alphaproteobacteria bacterium]|nr:DUF4255 domain-containing protein [Alphaproteobacteria bacterium]